VILHGGKVIAERVAPQARVLVAIEAASLRMQIVRLLNRDARLGVIAQASSTRGAIRLLSEYRTDVLLLDAQMAGLALTEAVERIRADRPEVNVVLLGSRQMRAAALALSSDAASYISSEASAASIITAILAACDGWIVTIQSEPSLDALGRARSRRVDGLTEREIEVLTLAARGYGYKQIGSRLGITKNTVRNHVSNIYAKIGVGDRSRAALYAAQHRLVRL
jgi:DNA-binding NarL/FixJ family response regulator